MHDCLFAVSYYKSNDMYYILQVSMMQTPMSLVRLYNKFLDIFLGKWSPYEIFNVSQLCEVSRVFYFLNNALGVQL